MKRKIRLNKQIAKDYERLVAEISELNGFLYHSNSIVESYVKSFTKSKSDFKKTGIDIFLVSHFTYRSPYDRKLIFGKSYFAKTNNFQKKIASIKRKVNNYYVALGYEFFESFLRSVASRIIINNPFIVEYNEKLGFRSYRSCIIYLQTNYRKNMDIIRLFRKINEELDLKFKKHKGLNNYLNFYEVYTKCRNHIIHTNGSIDKNSFVKLGKLNMEFAADWFGTTKHGRNRYLIDTSQTSKKVLQTIIEFAYLLLTSFDSKLIKVDIK